LSFGKQKTTTQRIEREGDMNNSHHRIAWKTSGARKRTGRKLPVIEQADVGIPGLWEGEEGYVGRGSGAYDITEERSAHWAEKNELKRDRTWGIVTDLPRSRWEGSSAKALKKGTV